MPPPQWHARLRPRTAEYAQVRRVTSVTEAAFHLDALTGDPLDPLSCVAVRVCGVTRHYNAATLVQCRIGGADGGCSWLAEPFSGCRITRRDEELVAALALRGAAGHATRSELRSFDFGC